MTREEAILWMRVLKHSKVNWVGEKAEEEDIIARCEEAEQEAIDMAISALSADAVSREHHDMEIKELKHQIKDQADMVSVVRCKDCRWWKDDYMGTWCSRLCGVRVTNADDYCSWGERREP